MPRTLEAEPLAVSISEACQRLGVGETTLRAMLDAGRLPFSRLGALPEKRGRVVIKVADLTALLDATRGEPGSLPPPASRRKARKPKRRAGKAVRR
jgi:excisionase family DNA binding protein